MPLGLDLERYRQEALAQHNLYRAQCKAEPLQKNATLDQLAQVWCEKLAANNQFVHSGTVEYGENSYKKTPFDFANDDGLRRAAAYATTGLMFVVGATPVKVWFNEKAKYNAARPDTALHFTQVVWANSKQFGLGACNASSGGLIFVANYYPRGNYKDQFTANVGC